MTFITNVVTAPRETQLDSFGRLRVSNPYTQVDTNHVDGLNDIAETQSISGTGTITLSTNHPSVAMALTGTGTLIRQSRTRGSYQPSKSLLIFLSGVINNGSNGTNVTSRIGYFDTNNGVYFEHRGNGAAGTMYVVIRSSNTGSIVNTAVVQSSWNFDKMDGTGPSKITIDPTKTLIYMFDIEWLGVGTVRASIVVDGQFYIVHKFHNSNLNTVPYMNTASLPLRYEISGTGNTGSLLKICGSVSSEGGYTPAGRYISVSNTNGSVAINSSTKKPVISIRLKSTAADKNVIAAAVSALSTASRNMYVELVIFRDVTTPLTGASWVSAGTDSFIEYDISATAVNTGGTVITSGYMGNKGDQTFTQAFTRVSRNTILSINLDGVSDVLTIRAITMTNTDSLSASLDVLEYI